jgi:hypothetical protein
VDGAQSQWRRWRAMVVLEEAAAALVPQSRGTDLARLPDTGLVLPSELTFLALINESGVSMR